MGHCLVVRFRARLVACSALRVRRAYCRHLLITNQPTHRHARHQQCSLLRNKEGREGGGEGEEGRLAGWVVGGGWCVGV